MAELRTAQVNVPDGMIDLGIGQPGVKLLPLEIFRQASEHRLSQGTADMLNYGAEQGDGYFRVELARYLAQAYRVPVAPEQLFVTAGASQALDLICTLYTKPGDTIFVEEPSYFLALRIFADHGLKVVGIPMDADGLNLTALADEVARAKPVFLYTIPTYQNPTGLTLTHARRQQLVALGQEHGFLIVADEVYHLLDYGTPPPPPLASHIEGGPGSTSPILSIGSFSKILAPGLRLGWIQTSSDHMRRFVTCGMVDSGGGLNPITSSIVRSVVELGLQESHVTWLKQTYAQRVGVVADALQGSLGNRVSYVKPEGGFFFWLRLNGDVDTRTLLATASQEYHVRFQPGIQFSSQNGLHDCLRLSFAFYGERELCTGIERLGRAVAGGGKKQSSGPRNRA